MRAHPRTALSALALLGIAHAASAQDASRYPLVVIEQHRASIVDGIVSKWGPALASAPGVSRRSPGEVALALSGLRADRLLAASLAGTAATVQDVLAT